MSTIPPTPITRVPSGAKQPRTRRSAVTTKATRGATAIASRVSSPPDALTALERHQQFDRALYHAGKIVAGLHFGIPPTAVIPTGPDGSPCAISVLSPNIAAVASALSHFSRKEEDFQQIIIIEYAGVVLTLDPADYEYPGIVDTEALLAQLRTNECARARLSKKLIRQARALMRRPDYLRAVFALAGTLLATGGHLDPQMALITVRDEIAFYHAEMRGEPLRHWFHRLATRTGSAMRVLLPNSPWAQAGIHEALRPRLQ